LSEAIGFPRDLAAHLEPLGVLVEHRIDDVDEGLVAREQAVAAGQQIAFEPAFAEVFGEHFHHPAVGRELVVAGSMSAIQALPVTSMTAPRRLEAVSSGPKRRKLAGRLSHHLGEKAPITRVASARTLPGRHRDGEVAEIGHHQRHQQLAAVGVGVGAHAARAGGGQAGEFGVEAAGGVEEFLGA
jgi:hypothetical protein